MMHFWISSPYRRWRFLRSLVDFTALILFTAPIHLPPKEVGVFLLIYDKNFICKSVLSDQLFRFLDRTTKWPTFHSYECLLLSDQLFKDNCSLIPLSCARPQDLSIESAQTQLPSLKLWHTIGECWCIPYDYDTHYKKRFLKNQVFKNKNLNQKCKSL